MATRPGTPAAPAVTTSLPLVGRAGEMARLSSLLDGAAQGTGQTLFLFGEGGVGKTRLVTLLAERARKRGCTALIGRAYPVETGVPYALFADAFRPLFSGMDAAQLAVLTRGASGALASLFPGLPGAESTTDRERASTGGDPAELKARLLWNFAQLLERISSRQPLLIILENMQWADASSLELFHFVARQIPTGVKVALVGTYNEAERDSNPALRTTEQSLVRLGVAVIQRVEPLREADVAQLVRDMFGTEESNLGRFPALLYSWTRGNPFFIESLR